MTVLESTPIAVPADPRDLIEPGLFARIAARVARHESVERELAERIVVQALGFLYACAKNPGIKMAPSKRIDSGWHAFVLYTREYAEFCQRVADRFIHHAPDDDEDSDEHIDEPGLINVSVNVMTVLGLPVDRELWLGEEADCSQCYACCSDSP